MSAEISTGYQHPKMLTRRDYLLLVILGLCAAVLIALTQPVPGYMDAEYYYSGGTRLAEGAGFSEMVIWNYLDNPQGLPHPSFTYWMPLPALLAAAGMVLTRQSDFLSARIAFILLAGILPAFAAFFCYTLCQRRDWAWLVGMVSVFSGFYTIYLVNTESFALYMLLGGLFLLVAVKPDALFNKWNHSAQFLLLGLISGLMHLTRADGILWLGCAILLAVIYSYEKSFLRWIRAALLFCLLVGAGYIVVMGAWYWRNWSQFGTLLSPGSSYTLFLLNYNQLFSFSVDRLTMQNWLAAGWGQHLAAWIKALQLNLQTTLAVQMEIVLLPFILAGAWRLRRERLVQLGGFMWLATLLVMTFIFPFSGSRGGFLHSGAAVQVLIWSCFPAGLDAAIQLGVRYRNWDSRQAWKFFSAGLVVICLLFSAGLYWARVMKPVNGSSVWRVGWDEARQVNASLARMGISPTEAILINNPPGFYAATRRPAVVIPDGDENTLLLAARRYGINYIIVEENHPIGLANLYQNQQPMDGLTLLGKIGTAQIYRVD